MKNRWKRVKLEAGRLGRPMKNEGENQHITKAED